MYPAKIELKVNGNSRGSAAFYRVALSFVSLLLIVAQKGLFSHTFGRIACLTTVLFFNDSPKHVSRLLKQFRGHFTRLNFQITV